MPLEFATCRVIVICRGMLEKLMAAILSAFGKLSFFVTRGCSRELREREWKDGLSRFNSLVLNSFTAKNERPSLSLFFHSLMTFYKIVGKFQCKKVKDTVCFLHSCQNFDD